MWLFTLILLIGILNKDSEGYHQHLNFSLNDIPIGIKSVECSGGKSSCPNNETCCQLESGQHGCCPILDAVCCSDQLHCCPNGYTCDIEHSRCQKGSEESHDVLCPGGEMSCADGETVCGLQSDDCGCCPLSDGVCCNDNSHCCPQGYTCNVEENKCEKTGISVPWFTKKPASPLNNPSKLIISHPSSSVSTVQCSSDEKTFCPEDTTCCEFSNSSYGCCPYRQASCCSDKIHCCEEGYSCDEAGSRCIRHLNLIPLSTFEEQICPDGVTKCSLTSTCCPNKNNDETTYSCCPNARGVCCGSNGSSCCPHKYNCDEDHLTCQSNENIPLENEIFHKSEPLDGNGPNACQSDTDCHGGQKCCKPSGVCCSSCGRIGCSINE